MGEWLFELFKLFSSTVVYDVFLIQALKSLRNYPLPIATGKDCKMLEYFGKFCIQPTVKCHILNIFNGRGSGNSVLIVTIICLNI